MLSKLDDGTRVVWYNHYREAFEKMWSRKGRAKKVGNPDFASIISNIGDDEQMLEYFQAEAKKHFGVDIVTSMQNEGGARPSAFGHGGYLPASRSSAFGHDGKPHVTSKGEKSGPGQKPDLPWMRTAARGVVQGGTKPKAGKGTQLRGQPDWHKGWLSQDEWTEPVLAQEDLFTNFGVALVARDFFPAAR